MAVQFAETPQPTAYHFSTDQYEKMISSGVFTSADNVELIDGEIVKMAPRGLRHEACVRRLQLLFHEMLGRSAIVSSQNSLTIPPNSQPEPDVALLKWREDMYEISRPTPADALLVIEVSDSTLKEDRGRKKALYAKAGVSDYWIVNLQDDLVEVYSGLSHGSYTVTSVMKLGDNIPLTGGLQGIVAVDSILRPDLKSNS